MGKFKGGHFASAVRGTNREDGLQDKKNTVRDKGKIFHNEEMIKAPLKQ